MAVRPIDAVQVLHNINSRRRPTPVSDFESGFNNGLNQAMWEITHAPTLTQPPITGDTSDGYHTFNELYHHRAILFSVICNERPEVAWKSKRHHDGTMYDGMFIVGIDTPEGQATYHYDVEPYWNLFRVKELELAPEWDGHTPGEAIRRIGTLTQPNEPLTLEQLQEMDGEPVWVKQLKGLSVCDTDWAVVEFRLEPDVKHDKIRVWWPGSEDEDTPSEDDYGKTWLAYRRPPEGEEEEKHVIEITENL